MEVEIYKMRYKISKNIDNLRILGENFVKNNKNKGNIILNNKKVRIKSMLPINNLKQNKIKMVLSKNIYNISYLFKDCELLESLSFKNIQNIQRNIDNIQVIDNENRNLFINMNISINESLSNIYTDYFSNISELTKKEEETFGVYLNLPNSLKRNINYFINMSYMFSNCNSLKFVPDISLWKANNIGNIVNMSYMFSNCNSLLSLPDLSKWKTDNVNNMSYMFSNCKSLLSLPDISKWKTDNVIDMSYMFCNCKSLLSLPDISKWNTNNINNMSHMFSNCNSLISLPDISKWNTVNLNNLSYIFSNCENLLSLTNISKWNTININNMSYIFNNCRSLTSLPDIS